MEVQFLLHKIKICLINVIYIPSTCFGKETMKLYSSFNDLPNKKRLWNSIFYLVKKICLINVKI